MSSYKQPIDIQSRFQINVIWIISTILNRSDLYLMKYRHYGAVKGGVWIKVRSEVQKHLRSFFPVLKKTIFNLCLTKITSFPFTGSQHTDQPQIKQPDVLPISTRTSRINSLAQKNKFTLILQWITFSFDTFTVAVFLINVCNVTRWWESRTTVRSLLQHIPKILSGVKVWTPCVTMSSHAPEPLFHTCSPMKPANVILEYGKMTMPGKKIKKKSIDEITWSLYSGSQRASVFGHVMLPILHLTN